jgi:hypothetical protein
LPKRIILLIHPRILRYFAILFLGIVFGSVYVNTQYGKRIDILMLENQNLNSELEASREELQEVKDNLSQKDRREITGIEVYVSIKNGSFNKLERESIQMEISQKVKKMLESLKGRELKNLDYTLIPQILNQRIIEVEGKEFTLETEMLVLDEKIVIHLQAVKKQE